MENEYRSAMLTHDATTVGYRLSYLANFFVGPVYSEIARVHGLARSEFVVLVCLSQLGTLTAQDVCEITGRPKNSISQAVTKLSKAGFVARSVDPGDGRRVRLSLTGSGRRIHSQAMPLFQKREEEMLSVLGAREREQFEKLLRKLVLRDDDWAQASY